MKSYHIMFTGKVQGVWFRRTCRNYAKEIGLKGWIKNLEDGRVEMIAEGPENLLDMLLAQLQADFQIENIENVKAAPSENYKDFAIEY